MQVSTARIPVAETFLTEIMHVTPRRTEWLPEQDSSHSRVPENYFNQESKAKPRSLLTARIPVSETGHYLMTSSELNSEERGCVCRKCREYPLQGTLS